MQREQTKKKTTKKVDLVSKTITLHLHHTFGCIFCRFFYVDYHVKFPNFTFEGGRKQMTTNFSFSFKIWLEPGSKNPTVGALWDICVAINDRIS